jgi:hypothetical protein
MIARTISIPYRSRKDEFKLLPISDIHYGHATCDSRKLISDLKKHVDEKTFIIGVGDWLDMIIVQDVKRYIKVFDAMKSGALIDEQIAGLAEIFKPYARNVIAIGDGNHEDTIIRIGTNPMKRLADMLTTKDHAPIYVGYSWLLALSFHLPSGSQGRTCIIRGHHGWGGQTRTQGADITKYSNDVLFWSADLFLYGHTHNLKVNPVQEGRMVGKSGWRTFTKKMLVCGSYQRTYGNSAEATYAEKRGFPPVSTQCPIVYLRPGASRGPEIKVMI